MNRHLKYKHSILLIAGISTILAGAIHATLVALAHVAPLPIETIFFVFAGLLQIVIAKSVIRTGRLKHTAALFSINGALVVLWVLSRTLRAPFMNSPESINTLGVLVVLLQGVSIASVTLLKWMDKERIRHIHGYSFAHVCSILLLASLLSGFGIFGGGRVGEIFLPDRTLDHSHGGVGHGHKEGSHNESSEVGGFGVDINTVTPDSEGGIKEITVKEGGHHDDSPHLHE